MHEQRNICPCNLTVTSPHRTVLLAAEESGASQDEWSLLTLITIVKTMPRCAGLQCSIGVVHPSVLDDSAVRFNVGVVHGHTNLVKLSVIKEN